MLYAIGGRGIEVGLAVIWSPVHKTKHEVKWIFDQNEFQDKYNLYEPYYTQEKYNEIIWVPVCEENRVLTRDNIKTQTLLIHHNLVFHYIKAQKEFEYDYKKMTND